MILPQLLAGVASGAIYTSVALALVMIYKATHQVNFAQGELAMCSTYACASLIDAGVPYWAAFALTLAISFVAGVALERVIVRRFRGAPILTQVIVLIGLMTLFNSLAGWICGPSLRPFPSPFDPHAGYASRYLSAHAIGMIGVTLIVLILVFGFFRYTRLGLAMRAAADHPASARLLGIRVGWMLALGWGLAALLGAVAGVMAAPMFSLDPGMMSGVLLYGFAAALLGGIDNPWGAPVGGVLVGVLDNLAGGYLVGSQLKLALALCVIIGVLILRPSGLLGRRVVARV